MSLSQEFEPETDMVEALSPFRAAFAKARVEGTSLVDSQRPATSKPNGITGREMPPLGKFEMRIEKRRGKRSADIRRWNKLGDDGWELVTVIGEEAFFRRSRHGYGGVLPHQHMP